ncbi:MAG: hypothetical protein JRI76_01480 [Deltaproteobacteria bacterium]|nr:hypothetical protein [Deltaproteobacteria bacterium]MBW1954774.1 hypothetical protein [Deltaproteobacteria bacterium]MBW2040681.1 hypothetical protein [Deltaproteobacteria bacterium]MBW2132506.1 hypothetical protein [Deltaproteobacteria bacterium]
MERPRTPAKSPETAHQDAEVCVEVDPGICGFHCTVRVFRSKAKVVEIEISGSECRQIQRLSEKLESISLKDLFKPMTKNPVFLAAENSRCHTTCIVPSAVLKAAEAALEMALPSAVRIRFLKRGEKVEDE